MLNIYAADCRGTDYVLRPEFLRFDKKRSSFLESCENSAVRSRCAAAGRMLDDLLTSRFSPNYTERFSLTYNSCGKPFMHPHPDWHFNIARTENRVFCIESDKPVGIDAEDISADHISAAELYFTEDEREYLTCSADKAAVFTVIWTLKESYMKYLGSGFSVSPVSFSILPVCENSAVYDAEKQCTFVNKLFADVSVSVCAAGKADIGEISLKGMVLG